jgi:LysR family glycine cleavage system transcriptional activator
MLFQEYLTPMCSPELLAGPKPLQEPSDLRHHVLIRDESMSTIPRAPGWADWLKLAGVEGVNPLRGPDFSHADHALDAALGGGGVVLGRVRLALSDLKTGRLVMPFDIRLPTGLSFSAVCQQNRKDEPRIAAFFAWMREQADADLAFIGES